MFLVSDTQRERHELIRSFLSKERAPIAVILAAVDFEWTLRRAILALGTTSTKHIREHVIYKVSGLKLYKEKWKEEVKPRFGIDLTGLITHWSDLSDAFDLRSRLVHGESGTVTPEYANPHVNHILKAAELLEAFAKEKDNRSLYGRKIIRRKPWSPSK